MAQSIVQKSLHSVWLQNDMAWHVGRYVIMPDHVHFLCRPAFTNLEEHPGVESWTAYWESNFSKQTQNKMWCWQRGVFHHRIRSDAHLAETINYMRHNPVRADLAKDPDTWAWQGEVHNLRIE